MQALMNVRKFVLPIVTNNRRKEESFRAYEEFEEYLNVNTKIGFT